MERGCKKVVTGGGARLPVSQCQHVAKPALLFLLLLSLALLLWLALCLCLSFLSSLGLSHSHHSLTLLPPKPTPRLQFANWLTCFWQSDSVVDGKAAHAAKADPFEIRFEDVQELKWLGAGAHGCVFLGTYNHEEVAVKKLR